MGDGAERCDEGEGDKWSERSIKPAQSARCARRSAIAAFTTPCRPSDRGQLHRVLVEGQNSSLLLESHIFPFQEPVNNILLYKVHRTASGLPSPTETDVALSL